MASLSEQIFQTVQALSKKEQQQVLNFVGFLQRKRQRATAVEVEEAPQSFLEAAKDVIGMGEGPGDLTINPADLEVDGQ